MGFDETYFSEAHRVNRMLESHGFDHWPNMDELTEYVFDISDKLDVINDALAVIIEAEITRRQEQEESNEAVDCQQNDEGVEDE